ncbi:MAG: Inositol 2-dehydrogenase/D-chiro-inositol 3-dehydrogenase [Acidimicrobiales bacterium]|nr:MAG: gfo/Idh/MocA family oxidoreductase [Actinomycetota bacterium]MBV6508941.1 Inositol 2-dehydrogenase/D-chiro-inositol 3-dehydrogenase [Acidimicrobiales bacterium]RIK08422.1 MAG: hypothetical protein DCC48_00270 [Acidobacteriota bacterium]
MTVRLGFLGAGFIARLHADLLRGSGADFEWAGVYDLDPHRSRDFAGRYGARVMHDTEAVVESCDAVFICTWTSEHLRQVEAAAERSKAVFCEKPLAVDLAGAQQMAGIVLEAGVTNQVGLVLRSVPAVRAFRRMISDPRNGRVMNIVFRDDQYIPIQGMYQSTWRSEVDKAGAGTLMEHSIHDLDLIEWLVGPVSTVSAHSAEFHGISGIEDSVSVLLRFESGGNGSLASVWHDILARPSVRRIEVFCERAHLVLEGEWFGPLRWTRDDDEGVIEGEEIVRFLREHGEEPELAEASFLRAVDEGRPAEPDFSVALRAHRLVDAVYRSAARAAAPQAVE